MKTSIIRVILLVAIVIACNAPSKETSKEIEINIKEVVTESGEAKTIALLNVEGMSCEIGCAGLINKTLSSLKGVTLAEVDFEKKEAKVEYNEKVLTEKDVISAIEGLNDHQYNVTAVSIERKVPANS